MTLIQLLVTGTCAAAGLGALLVGNCLEAVLLWMLPIGYFAVTKWRKVREQRIAEMKKRQEESDRFWEKERERRKAEHVKSSAEIYERHRAQQMQQMNMMHQNSMQAAAAQQASMNQRGWADPRSQYGSDLADNIINLWAINSMLNQPSGIHASKVSASGPAITDAPKEPVTTDPIQFHSFVNSSSESSSSSSSYSSDTSSDSFGGSDTSSDSF